MALHFRCKDRRRTVRVMLAVPVRIQGQTKAGERFSTSTQTQSVSLHGASVELDLGVTVGSVLVLEKEGSKEKIEGRIVSIRPAKDGKTHVGVEFTSIQPHFWHIVFPVPGARPLRRVLTAPTKASA